WTDQPMTLDLDNGVVVFPDTFQGGIGDVYELASGFKSCCTSAGAGALGSRKDSEARLKAFVAATYEVRPMVWKVGWNVRGGPFVQPHLRSPRRSRCQRPSVVPRGHSLARAARAASPAGGAGASANGADCRPCGRRPAARRLAPECAPPAHDGGGLAPRRIADGAQPVWRQHRAALAARSRCVLQLTG